MRADRLLSMLMLLQIRGRMTADELAGELEVSTRTVYRDLDALTIAGVPVYADRGPSGGISLWENYRTNLTGLTKDEVRALFMFTVPGLFADLQADKAQQAATLKLMASLPAPFRQDAELVRQRIHLDPAAWFQPAEPTPYLPLIQEAVWHNRRLRLTYRRGDGDWVKRLVDPYGLVAKASVWYMVGYTSRMILTYRVARIQEAELTDSTFERQAGFNLADYWAKWRADFEARQNRYDVTVRVPPVGLLTLAQRFGDGIHRLVEQITPDAAGCCTLTLTFESSEAACQQLLGLGTVVEVVQPEELRVEMLAKAREMANFYTKPAIGS
jgi:predicted DNA-binding transcriptional regulator YafY